MKTHNRHSVRLKEYDYTQEGAYSVTICTQDKQYLFGKIINSEMVLNDVGEMIERNWNKLSQRFPNIELDEFIIMPNHLHGIIAVVGAALVAAQNNTMAAQNNTVAAQNDTMGAQNNTVAAQNDITRAAITGCVVTKFNNCSLT